MVLYALTNKYLEINMTNKKKSRKESALSARIDSRVKELADKWCKSRGLVMAHFIEEAIIDKLEEEHDASEISVLRREKIRPFDDVLKELDLND
jgi:Family of unknown function (DUF6290)